MPFTSSDWDPSEQLRTTDEVARLLRVEPETVRAYARTGKLRALKLGHEYRFRDAWVAAFIDGRGGRKRARVAEEPPGEKI
jgi:excisionase family DNA binding protein